MGNQAQRLYLEPGGQVALDRMVVSNLSLPVSSLD